MIPIQLEDQMQRSKRSSDLSLPPGLTERSLFLKEKYFLTALIGTIFTSLRVVTKAGLIPETGTEAILELAYFLLLGMVAYSLGVISGFYLATNDSPQLTHRSITTMTAITLASFVLSLAVGWLYSTAPIQDDTIKEKVWGMAVTIFHALLVSTLVVVGNIRVKRNLNAFTE